MVPRQTAFVSSSFFPSTRRRHFISPHLAPRRATLPTHPPRRAATTFAAPAIRCILPDPEAEERELIKELDEEERHRRIQQPSAFEKILTPVEEDAILDSVPGLRKLVADLNTRVAEDPLDPDDWRIYSHSYKLLNPFRVPRLLQLASVVALCVALQRLVLTVRARASFSQMLAFSLDVERTLQPAVFVVALVLLLFVRLRHPGRPHVDAVVRTLVMYTLSTLTLLPVAAIAATSNPVLALATGILVRGAMQLPALCLWTDLRRELLHKGGAVGPIFRAWRFITVFLLACPGLIIRAVALAGIFPALIPAVSSRAAALRMRVGARFPVALSLFNDPRGLFLAACICMCAAVMYLVYLVVFVSPFLRERRHRRCNSWLTNTCVDAGLYMPNVHPDEALLQSSAPDGMESYLPSKAMLMRHGNSVFELDSTYLSTDASLPIFTHLKKEQEILAKEGAEYWIRPREEELPYDDEGVDVQKAIEMLESWARPLAEDQEDVEFSDFFETLQDDEYTYDPAKGEWVFDEEVLAQKAAAMQRESEENGDTGQDDAIPATSFDATFAKNLEFIGPPSDDAMTITVPAELEPWLQKFAEEGGVPAGAEDHVPKELEPWLENMAKSIAASSPDEIPKELEPWLQKFVDEGEDDDEPNDPPLTVYV